MLSSCHCHQFPAGAGGCRDDAARRRASLEVSIRPISPREKPVRPQRVTRDADANLPVGTKFKLAIRAGRRLSGAERSLG